MGQHDRKTAHVQVRGWHPLRPGLQACSPGKPFYDSRPVRRNRDTRSLNTTDATPDGYHAQPVWSDPLSLATTHGVSLPAGTEMFHFPAYPRNKRSVPAHDGRRVPPFGDPRIKAMLEAPLGLSHPQTSFIGTVCQGIHHTPSQAAQQQDHCPTRGFPDSKIARRQIITLKMITKRSKRTIEFDSKSTAKQRFKNSCFARVHYPVLKPPRTPTGPGPRPTRPTASRQGHPENRTHPKRMRVAVREPKSIPIPLPDIPTGHPSP